MNIRFENLGLYNIDTDYLRYLNGIEPEVQFTQEKDYEQKPFLGILVTIDTYSGIEKCHISEPPKIQKRF